MKAKILSVNGENLKEIEVPKFFSREVREDIIFKVLESRKDKQPYSPSPVAGKQHSASGVINHRRHVWKTSYGKGTSRIPRKIMTRRGSQFIWVGAEVSSTIGGRRAHPPKVEGMINSKSINKKEEKLAFISSLAATANEDYIKSKYQTLVDKKITGLPFIIEDKITSMKTKELVSAMKKTLKDLYNVSERKKKVRAGVGKMRGRKYKTNSGLLIVIGKEENLKSNIFEIKNSTTVSVEDLAKGKPGRIVVYTEKAIKELEERVEGKK